MARKSRMNVDKAQSVQFGNKLIDWISHQPMLVLHEMAHGFHDRVLSDGYQPLINAFERARESGMYNCVKYCNGELRPHYALTDHREFFAELSEAYFGRNDYYPFDRIQLKKFDPESLRVIEEAWQLG